MKFRDAVCNAVLILFLALIPAAAAYSQNAGTSSQQSPQAPTPALNQSGPTQEHTAPAVGSTQTAPPQPGVGNTQTVASKSVAWGWLILGFIIGLLVGVVTWRRPRNAERPGETGRRVA